LSIVEKALQKLQAAKPAAAPVGALAKRPAASAPAVTSRPPVPKLQAVEEPRVASTIRLDPARLRAAGISAPTDGDVRRLTDELRRVKWALQANEATSKTGAQNVAMITSALPGEGKSFLSFNLALSIATESERHVWLFDADCIRQTLSRALGVEKLPGMLDVIADPTRRFEDVLVATDVPGLFVVPSGAERPDSPELLSSARAAQLFSEVGPQHPHVSILLDTAPVLATSVPQALAPLVGQIVMAVKADSTAPATVTEALTQLHRTDGVAMVLNQFQRFMRHDYYYDGYYETGARS